MGRNRLSVSLATVMVVFLELALALSAPAVAGDDETQGIKKIKKIKIKKQMVDCEGQECADHHRMIIEKHGDMDQIHVECEGEECEEEMQEVHAMAGHPVTWIEKECEGEDCDVQLKVFVTRDGELEQLHGAAAHHLMLHGEECEGEDCEKVRRVIIQDGEGLHETHGMGDHLIWFGDDAGAHHLKLLGAGKGGFLGIHLTDLTEELRTHFGAPADQGVMVGKVQAASAAEIAGLAVGDIITSVDGEPIGSAGELSHAIRSREAGESVSLGILRRGQADTLTAVLDETKLAAAHGRRTMVAFCDEGEDCEIHMGHHGAAYDCGGAEECEVEVECEHDECICTANGESIDCGELGLPHRFLDQ